MQKFEISQIKVPQIKACSSTLFINTSQSYLPHYNDQQIISSLKPKRIFKKQINQFKLPQIYEYYTNKTSKILNSLDPYDKANSFFGFISVKQKEDIVKSKKLDQSSIILKEQKKNEKDRPIFTIVIIALFFILLSIFVIVKFL